MKRDYWPASEWKRISPEEVGLDSAKLAALDATIKAGHKNIRGIVIVKHGKIGRAHV